MPDKDWKDMRFEYEYPEGLNLHPDSDLHKKIVQEVTDRAKDARQASRLARQEWQDTDKLQAAYVTVESQDDFNTRKSDPRKPVNIVVPFSRAAHEIFVTYQTLSFLADQLYRLRGVGGKRSHARALLHETLLNMQAVWFKHSLRHIIQYKDMYSYGLGALAPTWRRKTRRVPIDEEVTSLLRDELGDYMPNAQIGDIIRFFEEQVVCEGNELRNLDPYSLLLDPNVSVNDIQDGEFIGYMRSRSALNQLSRERDPDERMFNGKYLIEYLKANDHHGYSAAWRDSTSREDKFDTGIDPSMTPDKTDYTCHYIHMFMRIIPDDFELPGDKPEIWMFTIAADEVVVQCDRLELDHCDFPIVVGAPTTTGHDTWPVSGLSTTKGMQQTADFLINSFLQATRKSINGMTLFDPSVINKDDMMNPGPGKMVRLKRSLYGTGNIAQYVHQLQDNNTTGHHIAQAVQFHDLMHDLLGTQRILSGDMSGMPERPTAGGQMNAQQNALSRLQTGAQIVTEQCWYDLVMMMAYNDLQYMREDVALDIVGPQFDDRVRAELNLGPDDDTVMLSPYDLDASFDIMPMNRMKQQANMEGMMMVLERILSVPEIAMEVFAGVEAQSLFLHAARKMGFENVHEFVKHGGNLQAQAVPDDQVMHDLDAGNVVPMEGAMM